MISSLVLALVVSCPDVAAAADRAWDRVMGSFWCPKTGVIYDYVTADDRGDESSTAHLPTPEEIAVQFPNPNAWSTGMEDGVLKGSPMLLAALERLRAQDGNDAVAQETLEKVFAGLRRCATVSGQPGFVARSVSPADGRSYFYNSSRDQYTLFCYALWRYYASGFADDARKAEIRTLLVDVAAFVKRCLDDPAAEMTLVRADGKPADVSTLWGKDMKTAVREANGTFCNFSGVCPHEALRAQMMFGAAWAVTGDVKWRDEMRRLAADGIRIAETPFTMRLYPFALYQAQVSHRLLWEVETDPSLKAGYARLLKRYGDMAQGRLDDLERELAEIPGERLVRPVGLWRSASMSYRKGRLISGRPYMVPAIPWFNAVRSVGEDLGIAILVRALTPPDKVPAEEAGHFHRLFAGIDWSRYPCSSMTHSILAYWTLRREDRQPAEVSSLPVVVEKDASPSQRYAAEELSKYVGRITGRELQVKVRGEGERRRSAPCVRFVTTDEYGDDGFRLQVKDGDVVISGSRTYGCLYGVYELLETYAGCGWFSSRCEIVPKAEKVEVPDTLDVVQRPAFALREPYWYDAFDGDFAARLRLNGSGMRLGARHGGHNRRFSKRLWLCHTFQKLVPPAKYFAEHPEYFSEVRGRRLKDNSQLCLSNPDVLEIVVSNVLAEIRANPGIGYVGVSQNDWGNWCTCEKCRAVDDEEGSPSGSIVRFVNAVAERVEKSCPKVRIETLAYQYSRKPPKKTRVRHNVIPCLCSIECRVSRPLAEKSCPENAAFVEDLKGWAAQAPELYVWDYTTDFACYMHPMANVKALAENIRFFRDSRVTALFAQGDYEGPHAHFAELKAWLIAKLMWNPEQDLDTLVNRFFAGYFGAAAPFARRYYDSLQALPRPPDRQLWIYESPLSDNVPDSFLEESARIWAQAADAVRDDPVRAYNVRMAAMANDAVRFWRLNGELAPKKYLMVSDPAAYRAKYEAICRQAVPLARTLVARLDEERRIVFKEGHAADCNFPEPEARAVAAGRDLPEPTASGDEIVFEEDAMTLTLPGVKGELADDPLAGNGKAYRLFTTHRDWCVTLKLDQIAFDDAEYVLSARVRTEQDPGATNKAFWCGVEGGAARESTHARKVMAPEIKPGYAWYDIVTWKPANSQYVWFGPGISPTKGPKVRATYLDALRIRRVRGR